MRPSGGAELAPLAFFEFQVVLWLEVAAPSLTGPLAWHAGCLKRVVRVGIRKPESKEKEQDVTRGRFVCHRREEWFHDSRSAAVVGDDHLQRVCGGWLEAARVADDDLVRHSVTPGIVANDQ